MASEDGEHKSLSALFDDAFNIYGSLESMQEPTNSDKFQGKLREAISILEGITRKVSSLGLFSPNEDVEEIATADLKFLLLPALLGSLTMKLTSSDRRHAIDASEIYYKDFLKRCQNYGITKVDVQQNSDTSLTYYKQSDASQATHVLEMSKVREDKIKRYKETKQMENKLLELKKVLDGGTMEEEMKRDYYMMLISWWILQSQEELSSINMEKPLLEHMEKMKLNSNPADKPVQKKVQTTPLKPIIITKNDVQKKVYGLGYPSLPTLTVDEFYEQKVKEGTFAIPDMSLQTKALAGYDREAEKESDEIQKEIEIESDDLEALTKARDWDDWKDEHRRGWGNRKNMG